MASTTRSVQTFLNNMYPTTREEESPLERQLVDETSARRLPELTSARSEFKVVKKPKKPVTVSVQFRTDPENIKRAARGLGNPNLSAREVGKQCLEYFLEQECN